MNKQPGFANTTTCAIDAHSLLPSGEGGRRPDEGSAKSAAPHPDRTLSRLCEAPSPEGRGERAGIAQSRSRLSPLRNRRTCFHALAIFLALTASFATSSAAREPAWSNAQQLILVTTPDWNADHGTLRTFARTSQGWTEVSAAVAVVVGRAGSAWGVGLHPVQSGPQKKEGDGRAPAGVFAIGTAFGYARSADTALAYAAMDADDWCIDVADSPLYNRLVDAREVGAAAIAGSSEPMRRDLHADGDPRYRLGFVIEHNPRSVPGAGSCIFAHLWKSADSPTAGCTAMADAVMRRLLAWLRPEDHPVFVLLPQAEYVRLGAEWGLPRISSDTSLN